MLKLNCVMQLLVTELLTFKIIRNKMFIFESDLNSIEQCALKNQCRKTTVLSCYRSLVF